MIVLVASEFMNDISTSATVLQPAFQLKLNGQWTAHRLIQEILIFVYFRHSKLMKPSRPLKLITSTTTSSVDIAGIPVHSDGVISVYKCMPPTPRLTS